LIALIGPFFMPLMQMISLKTSMRIFILLIAISFVFLSCSTEKKDGNVTGKSGGTTQAGGYSLEVLPKIATSNVTLSAVPSGFAIADAKFAWMVNNKAIANSSSQLFSSSDLEKGDTVQVRAVIGGYEIMSDRITIVNSLPKIVKADLIPEAVAEAASLRVEASGRDIDGDPVTFLYEWTKNNEPAGKGDRIEGSLKRGDSIVLKIVPFDGTDHGESIIIRRELANMRPLISAHNVFTFDGKIYTYQVKASDPDGDSLTYAAASPANGIMIDPATGLLQWNVPPEFQGKRDVVITVSDGQGGTASYVITINIQ
jgi:hypothetical protein